MERNKGGEIVDNKVKGNWSHGNIVWKCVECDSEVHTFIDIDDGLEKTICDTCEAVILTNEVL